MQDPVLPTHRPGNHIIHHKAGEIVAQKFFQFLGTHFYFKTSVFKESDISGFFAHDNHISIAHPLSPKAARCRNPILPGISRRSETGRIQRAAKILFSLMITAPSCKGVFLKKIFSINFIGHLRFHHDPCLGIIVQFGILLKNNQSPRLRSRKFTQASTIASDTSSLITGLANNFSRLKIFCKLYLLPTSNKNRRTSC